MPNSVPPGLASVEAEAVSRGRLTGLVFSDVPTKAATARRLMDAVRLSKDQVEAIRERVEHVWVVSWADARSLLAKVIALQAEQEAAARHILALQVEVSRSNREH